MTWPVLKKLYALYKSIDRAVPHNSTLLDDGEVQNMINTSSILTVGRKLLIADDEFIRHFEATYLDRYLAYQSFLQQYKLDKPQSRFELDDIDTLMDVDRQMQNGDLFEIRRQIIDYNESLRGVSQMFFAHDKYLNDHPSLVEAMKAILNIEAFADERDQQYLYKLECHNPRCIVLCENLHFLRLPTKPRLYGIELWYAGGRNIAKLEFSQDRNLPLYYSCDWDFDGLDIYRLVKQILPTIVLLCPNGTPRSLEKTNHDSKWVDSDDPDKAGGLPIASFSQYELLQIRELVRERQWIIEESNDLLKMLENSGFRI